MISQTFYRFGDIEFTWGETLGLGRNHSLTVYSLRRISIIPFGVMSIVSKFLDTRVKLMRKLRKPFRPVVNLLCKWCTKNANLSIPTEKGVTLEFTDQQEFSRVNRNLQLSLRIREFSFRYRLWLFKVNLIQGKYRLQVCSLYLVICEYLHVS